MTENSSWSAVVRYQDGRWLKFENPLDTVRANELTDVKATLKKVDHASKQGMWCVGFVSYDASPAFDPGLVSSRDPDMPLAAFGIYETATPLTGLGAIDLNAFELKDWQSSCEPQHFAEAVKSIKELIAAGETYQVNFSYRLRSNFAGDPYEFFKSLANRQDSDHLAYLDFGNNVLCSASPEQFFNLKKGRLTTKPMKGTRPRSHHLAEDSKRKADLANDRKDLAENTMIVDMARNDLCRVSDTTVVVDRLHNIETYRTVHQLVSTVSTQTTAPVSEIFEALFPAASITGAPKYATTNIIAEMETKPRGIYCGAIGTVAPDGDASFNVAIRTASLNRSKAELIYGVGCGIVADSDPESEWQESKDKTRLLDPEPPAKPGQPDSTITAEIMPTRRHDFELIETMRWDRNSGIARLGRHLDRLEASAKHFEFKFDRATVASALGYQLEEFRHLNLKTKWAPSQLKVRLALADSGHVTIEVVPYDIATTAKPLKVAIGSQPIDTQNQFLYHKTSRRDVYTAAAKRFADYDDVILWNASGNVTETTIGNIVIDYNKKLLTPPIEAGLLPGAFRAELLATQKIEVADITFKQLHQAAAVYRISSLRGWARIDLPAIQ